MNKVILWLPAFLYCAIIFYLSSISNAEISSDPSTDFISRKLVHFFVFGVLSLLFLLPTKNYYLASLLAIVYAILDEYHQTFVPGRSGEIRDIIIDSSGVIIFMLITWILNQNHWKIQNK
jgi:VanZ family protein